MSAGRRTRRQMKRGRVVKALEEAAGQRARYVGDAGPYEVWQRGPVMHLVAKLPLGAPAEVAAAISRRRLATVTGVCECGASFRLHRGSLEMTHDDACPASDEGMAEVLDRHGWTAHYIAGRSA